MGSFLLSWNVHSVVLGSNCLFPRKMQHCINEKKDIVIEVETMDRTGTFLGSLWASKPNMIAVLLEAGLAKLQTAFGGDVVADASLLHQAEQSAKQQKLKLVEGWEVVNGSASDSSRQKEVLRAVEDRMVALIWKQLASLDLGEPPVIGNFNPKKGDLVLLNSTQTTHGTELRL